MGFTRIPEEAEKRCSELSGKEWKLATLYYRYADKSGTAWPSLETIATERAWTKSNACKARQGLIQKGWLRVIDGDKVQLLVGFMDFQNGNDSVSKMETEISKMETERFQNGNDSVSKMETEISKMETERFQNGNGNFQNGNDSVSKMEIPYKEEHDQHELDQLTRPKEQTSELLRDARPREVATASGRLLDARHSALKAIQSLTGYLPNKALWGELVEVLGDVPNYPRMDECFRAWTRRGYKPVNYGWLLDWYVNGIPEEQRPRAHSHSPPVDGMSPQSQANYDAVQRWLNKTEKTADDAAG